MLWEQSWTPLGWCIWPPMCTNMEIRASREAGNSLAANSLFSSLFKKYRKTPQRPFSSQPVSSARIQKLSD